MNPDTTLENRLIMLEEDLATVLNGLGKLQSDLERIAGTAGGLSDRGVRFKLRGTVLTIQHEIRDLRKNLQATPAPEAWVQYGDLRGRGDQVYGEFLEIVGGIVIRREIDEKICLIAQELVRGGWQPPSLTILAARDSYVPNLARLMRIRVSDRTVWSLPLTAHQFARVLIEDNVDFGNFARKQSQAEVAQDFPELVAADPDPNVQKKNLARRKKIERDANSRWEQLIADCLALYIVGPCYAGSALLLRFSPLAGLPDDETQAPDIERAHVCLDMLRTMDAGAREVSNPYKEFLNWLDQRWMQMLTGSGSAGALSAGRKTVLSEFVKDLFNLVDYVLPGVQYPTVEDQYSPDLGGWTIATRWYAEWRQAKNRQPPVGLTVPESVTSTSKVRDALNAGWLCRSTFDADGIKEVTKVVRDVCDDIIEKLYQRDDTRSTAAGTSGPTSPTR